MRHLLVEDNEALLSHLEGLAQKHFGLATLRPQQRQVFVSLRQHRQVLAMLPTGSGKTLLYALGSLLFSESVTIVICPLIALMREQRKRMADAGIPSVAIYSEQTEEERRQSYRSIFRGESKLLFVSPERFSLPSFQRFIRRLKIGMVVVDEAHCVVSWGHSFRPEYGQLAQLLGNLGASRILALTATASSRSRELIKNLVFPEPDSVCEVIDRPLKDNIRVESIRVYSEDQRWLEVKRLLDEANSQKTILYFTRREHCQKAAMELRAAGKNAIIYHAGLQRELRKSVEDYLRSTNRQVIICATLAFGMGIDMANVGMVVVVGFPANIEEAFQMMGRAGRQGETARAIIVWSGSDPKKRAFQFEKSMPQVSELVRRVQALSGTMPGTGQEVIVRQSVLENQLRYFVKNERELNSAVLNLISVLSMLGQGSALAATRSDWISFRMNRNDRLIGLLAELPVGISRRRMVLEWLQMRQGADVDRGTARRMVFPVSEVCEDLQILKERVVEVLRYYKECGDLDFEVISAAEAQQAVLLKGGVDDVLRLLGTYQRWRTALSHSLDALSTFVTADDCRMSQAESFFLMHHRSAMKHPVTRCMRCDLCETDLTSLKKGDRLPIASTLTLSPSERLR